MRRRWRLLVVGVTGAAVAGLGAYASWIANPPRPEEVGPADAIVVFAGRPERFQRGLELAEQGVADTVVFSSGELPRGFAEPCDQTRPFRVLCEAPDPANTAGEAQMFARLAAEHGWQRLVAVTSTYHVRRAELLLDRCYKREVEFVGVGDDDGLAGAVDSVGHEMAGLVKDWLTSHC